MEQIPTENPKVKELFKGIYEHLISPEYQELEAEMVVRVAMGAMSQFAENEGVQLGWLVTPKPEPVCETCNGTGEVSTMEKTHGAHEPHMADVGTAPCPDCQSKE